jgi:hypothetical protein
MTIARIPARWGTASREFALSADGVGPAMGSLGYWEFSGVYNSYTDRRY